MLDRYYLFHMQAYYPSGGWDDFVASSCDLDELKSKKSNADWAHIVDISTGKIVSTAGKSLGTEWKDEPDWIWNDVNEKD